VVILNKISKKKTGGAVFLSGNHILFLKFVFIGAIGAKPEAIWG
jgi:hypothetical protein